MLQQAIFKMTEVRRSSFFATSGQSKAADIIVRAGDAKGSPSDNFCGIRSDGSAGGTQQQR